MTWTVVPPGLTVRCGACGLVLDPDMPVALLTQKQLPRCAACAGAPVDHAQVDAERHRLEAQRVARPAVTPATVHRNRPIRRPVPLSAVADGVFDPKAAAAGRDD